MILYWKHLSLFSIVTLKGSWYMAFGDKFFPTSSSSIFGDLRTFKTKSSRAILAVTLEGVRLSLTALLEGICGEFKREFFHPLGIAERRPKYFKKFTFRPYFS